MKHSSIVEVKSNIEWCKEQIKEAKSGIKKPMNEDEWISHMNKIISGYNIVLNYIDEKPSDD